MGDGTQPSQVMPNITPIEAHKSQKVMFSQENLIRVQKIFQDICK
jgi:hypothetical protein